MPEAWVSLTAVLAGAALGSVYFGGLWWTARRLGSFHRPVRGILASALLRMGFALGGFYMVADGHWLRLLLCLVGFTMARAVVTWRTRLPPEQAGSGRAGLHHAP
jgi:F1F0 ATPase subunit 2